MKRIIAGIVLICLQLIPFLGNGVEINAFQNVTNFQVFLYDLAYVLGYFSVGIIGLILLIFGYRAYRKAKNKKSSNNYIIQTNTQEIINTTQADNLEIKETKPQSKRNKCSIKKFFSGFVNTLQSQKVAIVISVLICAALYLSFLTLAFTEKTERYTSICYTTKTGTHFHSHYCQYLNTAYETTVYEASKKYKPCAYCSPYGGTKMSITITERNYLAPALISIPISVVIYISLTNRKKDDNTNKGDVNP